MRRLEQEPQRPGAAGSSRKPEPLPAESALLGLQRSAGNRAVSALLSRQPSPTRPQASTSTLGLGDDVGVIPLESATPGKADRDGNAHELQVVFVGSAIVPKLQEMFASGTIVEQGFYSSAAMKLTLEGILISALQVTEDHENGGQMVAMTLNCTAIHHEKAP